MRSWWPERARIDGVSDRPDHHNPARSGHQDLIEVAQVDATDREPRAIARQRRRVSHEVEPWRGSTGLGRRRPARSDAEIVDAFLRRSSGNLVLGMCRPPDQHVVGHERAGNRHRQIVLSEMQNV